VAILTCKADVSEREGKRERSLGLAPLWSLLSLLPIPPATHHERRTIFQINVLGDGIPVGPESQGY